MQFSSALIIASVAAVAVAQTNGTAAGAASPSGGVVAGNGTAAGNSTSGNSSAKPSTHNENGASYSIANAGIVGAAVAGAVALIL